MNKGIKSILIGVLATALTYGVLYKKRPQSLKGHYVIRIKENENAIVGDQLTVERVAEHLERKLAHYDLKAETKFLNDRLIDLTIPNIMYPPEMIAAIITSKSDLEFREMYTLKELGKAYQDADSVLGFAKPEPAMEKVNSKKDTERVVF